MDKYLELLNIDKQTYVKATKKQKYIMLNNAFIECNFNIEDIKLENKYYKYLSLIFDICF